MADTKFKVGDLVRFNGESKHSVNPEKGTRGVIKSKHETGGDWWRVKWDGPGCEPMREYELDLIRSGPGSPNTTTLPNKFILQRESIFEFFATEKEARKRIAELADRTDLKRDSIRLIEIKKIRTVKLGTKITISK